MCDEILPWDCPIAIKEKGSFVADESGPTSKKEIKPMLLLLLCIYNPAKIICLYKMADQGGKRMTTLIN